MELLSKLGIDWKILIAQIVNFLLLLFVLFKFVYRPVLDMLDKRSKTIESGLKAAKESEDRLTEIEQLREQRIKETEHEVGKLLEHARNDAEIMKKGIVAAAQMQADDMVKRTRLQLEEEKEKLLTDVKREVTALVVTLTGKLLEKEFSSSDQKRLSDAVAHEMKSL